VKSAGTPVLGLEWKHPWKFVRAAKWGLSRQEPFHLSPVHGTTEPAAVTGRAHHRFTLCAPPPPLEGAGQSTPLDPGSCRSQQVSSSRSGRRLNPGPKLDPTEEEPIGAFLLLLSFSTYVLTPICIRSMTNFLATLQSPDPLPSTWIHVFLSWSACTEVKSARQTLSLTDSTSSLKAMKTTRFTK
jgi:hypothetical protein